MSGRRRGEHRDPVGAGLTVLWALDHAVVLGLLPVLIQHDDAPAMDRDSTSESAPDTPPAA
ncbi:hypothetical protein ACIGXM_33035 [Kitasatospora sp. NPDC052896]|uniref:hypothetical protein n=1 Tax=Kitasatospora sp. NPDC052896 TaxID=3364061 RepID=UPI0037CC8EA6